MRHVIALFIAGLLLSQALSAQDNSSTDYADCFGIWMRGSNQPAAVAEGRPWLKGSFVAINWSELEIQPGEYDWDFFDREMTQYADAGLYVQFMVWVGPHSPRWLYENGVPEVETTVTLNPRGVPHGWTYPFYLDEDYQRYYHRMSRAVAEHLDTLPAPVREKIICIQTAEGTTGDEGGYKGKPLDPRYELPEDQWRAFKFETWRLFDALYKDKQPKIHLLINSGNKGQYHDWILENMPDTWRKAGNPGHGYQLNDEMDMFAFLDPIINQRNVNGKYVRCRSEMDETFKGWFREAPVWNQYWLNLWTLHFGIDIFQNAENIIMDPRHEEGFTFASKYGGQKDPSTSPGAFCALHDGLDAGDFQRFPKAGFGPGEFNPRAKDQSEGIARCLKIAEAFAAQGARQGDPDKAMASIMQNRDASKMNDVGWNIRAGNYERYLTQIDPIETSQGYWRVGPKDQPYGRFARGFDVESGKNTFYFDLNDTFYPGVPGTPRVRVVYFDQGKGAWSLEYDAGKEMRRAGEIQLTGTGRWLTATFALDDATLANGGPRGCDLMLSNRGDSNVLFHMVELQR